jgi:fructose-bisphosphate aldolase class I
MNHYINVLLHQIPVGEFKLRMIGLNRSILGLQTVKCLKDCVPATVAGIAFLSGGQSDEEATIHLNLINQLGPLPWPVTFSYGRALQHLPQKTWAGKAENVQAAQRAFSHRSRMNGLAAQGTWKPDLEKVGMAA